MACVRLRVLGDVGLTVDGATVDLPGGKPLALLAMLALRCGRTVPAEQLVIGLWGENAPASTVKTLQVHVSALRRRLRTHGLDIGFHATGYRLHLEADRVDALRFEQRTDAGLSAWADRRVDDARELLRDALGEWTGEPLATVRDAPFAAAEIDRLQQRRRAAAIARIDADLTLGLGSTLVDEIRALAADHPYDERICGQLMVAVYRAGDAAGALAALRRFRRRLRDELGLEPGPELRSVEARILRQDEELLVPPTLRHAGRHNLPDDLASFIGRQDELRDLQSVLQTARVCTITGAGGAGKTRLAVATARNRLTDPDCSVWWIELATVADPTLVLAQVATALGLRSGAIDDLTAALASRRTLLVLDNAEHLLDAVAELVCSLVRSCPELRVLVTSREALGVDGEQVYRIPALGLPAVTDADALAAGDAVRLFVERARLHLPGFVLDESSAPMVAGICRRVDGLPLAIELAAARLSSLPLAVLADRLGVRLSLLSTGRRRTVSRQQTIHAMVDWSYRVLDDEARGTLQALSVFRGGFTMAGAVRVTGDDGVDALSELVDKSLVDVADHASGRFRMLEPIREFAADRLVERGDGHRRTVLALHADHVLDLVDRAAAVLDGGGREQTTVLDRLDQERDNIAAAAQTLVEQDRIGDGLRLVHRLRFYWDMRGHFAEGARIAELFCDRAATSGGADLSEDLGLALCTAADMYDSLGDAAGHARCSQRAMTIAQRSGSGTLRTLAAIVVSNAAIQGGRAREGLAALQAHRDRIDPTTIDPVVELRLGITESYAAIVCEDWMTARDGLTRVISAASAAGNDRVHALGLSNLSVVDLADGDLTGATAHLEQADELIAPMRDPTSTAYIKINLGLTALLRGDLITARSRYREALLIGGAHGESTMVHSALSGMAVTLRGDERAERAALLLHGVVERFLGAQSSSLDPVELRQREDDLSERAGRLGTASVRRLLDDGRRLDVAAAVGLALEASTAPSSTAVDGGPVSSGSGKVPV